MVKVNENFIKLPQSYLFSTIGKKVAQYKKNNPEKPVISLGIGDVTRPLCPAVIDAMNKAVAEMAVDSSFRGYPPEQGYAFLRETILENDYLARGINLAADEIFVSDGAKSDTANIGDIFDSDNIVAVCDPVYPVYVDTNVMYGRAGELGDNGKWDKLYYMECNEENHFLPELPTSHVDLIYLCFPNNPTGGSISREALQKWVDYAIANDSIILYDSAYEAFITDDSPHSIFEIEGATKCSIEFRSFSKTAGFTGVRCAFTVVPKELVVGGVSLNALWNRRQCTKFNGVSYITQCAAVAIYSDEGKHQIRENIDFYMGNAKIIREALEKAGLRVFGGLNAPYIWVKTPDGVSSWGFFDMLLENVQVVGTPGSGFGPAGEGYFRLTAFGSRENTLTAVERISNFLL